MSQTSLHKTWKSVLESNALTAELETLALAPFVGSVMEFIEYLPPCLNLKSNKDIGWSITMLVNEVRYLIPSKSHTA